MAWLPIAVSAYFLIALEVIMDKFLLTSKRVSHPAIYTFYTGILSLFALAFFPFGFHMISGNKIIASLVAGIIFVYAILALFFAINKSEASRVIPVVGAVVPMVTLFLSSGLIISEHLGKLEVIGVGMLIIGGLGISLDLSSKNSRKFFVGFAHSIIAGILLAISYTVFKEFYNHDNFINVYIWTRFGVLLGALSLLVVPVWRKLILNSFLKFKKPSTKNKFSGILFVLNKALGGTGSIVKEYATSIGSVTIVNALVSTEYIFIFLLGLSFSFWLPKVFKEKRDSESIIQKILAIIIITTGIVLISKFK